VLSGVLLGALAAPALAAPAAQDREPSELVAELAYDRRRDPDEPGLLDRYARALGEAGDRDAELAYLLLARDGYARLGPGVDVTGRRAVSALGERLDAIDSSLDRLDGYVGAYVRELADVMKLYARNQHKPRNALDLAASILRREPDHKPALALVDEIAASEPALAPELRRLRAAPALDRPRSFQIEWAEQHRAWADAGRVTTARYDLRCNIGYDVLHRAAYLLEEAADAYADVFGVQPEPAGPTPVHLYRALAEYDSGLADVPHDPLNLAHMNGYVEWTETGDGRRVDPTFTFTLHVRDTREEGLPLEAFEHELVREASQQYVAVASGAFRTPPWLIDGCGGWFDGADLDEDGALRAGRVVPLRLTWLYRLLVKRTVGAPDDGHERAALHAVPLLEAALARTRDNPPDFDDVAVAWGLVHFLLTERDADGSRPLRPLLREALRAVASGQESGRAVFEQAVLEPGGLSLAAFARRWSAAMIALYDAQQDPPETARELVARGERWLAEGHAEAARADFLEALAYDPGSVTARLGLAGLRAGSKDRADADATLLYARRAFRAAVRADDEAGAEQARALAGAADPAGFRRLLAAEDAYRAKVSAVVESQLGRGRPRAALAVSRLYLDEVLGDAAQDALAVRLAAEGVRFSRTLSLFDGRSLDGLLGSPVGVTAGDAELRMASVRPEEVMVLCERPLAPCLRLEGDVQFDDANTLFAVTLRGGSALGLRGACLRPADDDGNPIGLPDSEYQPFDRLGYGQIADLSERVTEVHLRPVLDLGAPRACPAPLLPGRWIPFALDRSEPGTLSLFFDGREVARWPVPLDRGPVQPGLIVYGGSARVRALRVVEFDRL
jgi:tetratricopeptide (TPR) repeat protein